MSPARLRSGLRFLERKPSQRVHGDVLPANGKVDHLPDVDALVVDGLGLGARLHAFRAIGIDEREVNRRELGMAPLLSQREDSPADQFRLGEGLGSSQLRPLVSLVGRQDTGNRWRLDGLGKLALGQLRGNVDRLLASCLLVGGLEGAARLLAIDLDVRVPLPAALMIRTPSVICSESLNSDSFCMSTS